MRRSTSTYPGPHQIADEAEQRQWKIAFWQVLYAFGRSPGRFVPTEYFRPILLPECPEEALNALAIDVASCFHLVPAVESHTVGGA